MLKQKKINHSKIIKNNITTFIGMMGSGKSKFGRLIAKNFNLPSLSMGMSNDYLEATKYGATYLRIGSKIFGNRN